MERFIIEKTMLTFPSHSLEEQRRNSTKPLKANQRLFFHVYLKLLLMNLRSINLKSRSKLSPMVQCLQLEKA